jgi:threonine aldolase
VEANITFAWFDPATMAAARGVGAEFYQDSPVTAADGTLEVRLVTSWSTEPEEIDALIAAVSPVTGQQSL